MPSQCSMARTVVPFRVAPLSPCNTGLSGMDGFGERGAPDQMRGVIGAVGVMDLEADDLAAVDVEDQVQIEPPSLHIRGQERHIPTPDVSRSGGDVRGWRA